MPGNEQNDITGKVAEKAIDVLANNSGVLAATLGLAAGGALLVKIVYDSLAEIPAFSQSELARHHNLLTIWKSHFPNKDIPPAWLLEKNKPKEALDLVVNGRRLKAEAELLKRANTHDHEARSIMLNHIGDLFISISKRWKIKDRMLYFSKYAVRPDGVDMMFYNELANWLLTTAANLRPDQDQSIEEYAVMLSYCNSIEQRVLTADSREVSRNNPNSTLIRIVSNLRNHHDKLVELNLAKSFNALMTDLENFVLGLASRTFDMLYLLINKTEGTHLILDKFLSPTSVDYKIKDIRDMELGDWLYKTLQVAGITYQTFEPTRTLNLKKDIKMHLKGKHPHDIDYQHTGLSWGARPFTKMPNENFPNGVLKSRYYLSEIRELHCSTLELYYMTQNFIRSSRASENFGDVWMYGTRAARATLKELLASVKFVIDEHINRVAQFWEVYYTQDFREIAKKNAWNLSQKEYAPLVHINDTVIVEMQSLQSQIWGKNDTIRQKIESYPERVHLLHKSKIDFFKGVLEHREFHQQTDSDDYRTAKAELDRLLTASDHIDTEMTNDECDFAAFPLEFSDVKESTVIPKDDKLAKALDCLVVVKKGEFVFSRKYQNLFHIRDEYFYSDLQRRVYDTVLRKYHALVNYSPSIDFWLGPLNYSSSQFNELRYRYACLYDAFEIMYPVCQNLSSVELALFKQYNEVGIGIFDQTLFRFIAIIEHQAILFRDDSHITLPEIISDAHSATNINREDDGSYTVERQQRYSMLQEQTVLTCGTLAQPKKDVADNCHLNDRSISDGKKDDLDNYHPQMKAQPKQKVGFFERILNPFSLLKTNQAASKEELRLEPK